MTDSTIINGSRKLFINSDGSINIKESPNITIIDKASATIEYYGFASPNTSLSDPYWRIQRKEISGDITTFLFAEGNTNFDKVWNDRGVYTYS